MTDEKICSRCELPKPVSEFYIRSDRPSGVMPHCKICDKARVKRYQESENGSKVILKYSRLPKVIEMRLKWRESPNGKKSGKYYLRKKRARDVNYRIASSLRTIIGHSLKRQGAKKSKRSMELVGCTIEFLKNHLEAKFKSGMTWSNWGRKGWHIDHLVPCASFLLTDPNEQKKCFNFKNLQPLWAHENHSKGARVIS